MRRLWIIGGSVGTALALVFATYLFINLIAHEQVTEVDTFAAADVTSIDVSGDNGNVELVGRDVEEIRVVAHVDHGLRRTRTIAEVRDGTLVVDNDCPTGPPVHCRVDYEIVVPTDLPAAVDVDNGTVTARDLQAGIAARTDNGRIDVARLGGPVELRSRNGSVHGRNLRGDAAARTDNGRITLSFAEAPRAVDASTRNGSIEVVVPDDGTTYRVHTHNVVGSTDTAIRTDPGSDRTISAETRHGSVTVRYPTG